MLSLATFYSALKKIADISVHLLTDDHIADVINAAILVLHPSDQMAAKESYNDLIADNADGYIRLDAKLAEAMKH